MYFSFHGERKVRKECRLRKRSASKLGKIDAGLMDEVEPSFFVIPSPLRIPLPCSPAASVGGEMLADFGILMGIADFNGGAGGCGLTGFALGSTCYCLGEGLARGLARLRDVRGYLFHEKVIGAR